MGTNRVQRVKDVKRKDGFYTLTIDGEERKFVSVTTVLNVINKPALVNWAAKQAAKLVLDDPETYSSVDKAASGIYGARDSAADRGSTVHSAVEAILNDADLDVASMPEKFAGFVSAFKSWFSTIEAGFDLIHSECTLYSTVHGYAGTTDLICRIGGRVFLVDFKTGKFIYPEASLQLAAYKHADLWLPKTVMCDLCSGSGRVPPKAYRMKLGDEKDFDTCPDCMGTTRVRGDLVQRQVEIEATAVLLLQENGRFKYEEVDAPLDAFLAAKRLWQWQRSA